MSKKIDIAKQVEQEHACLKRDIGIIKKEVEREVTPEDFSEWRLEFKWRLRDLRNHLGKHFDFEEEGGFMVEIMEEMPEATNKVQQLESEHDEILSNLDEILADLKAIQSKDDVRFADIRNRVIRLLDIQEKHEATENELIQKVYYQDYGYPGAS